MGNDGFTPITTETRLSLPLNGTVYTTRRKVSSEKPTPEVGATMAAELGAAWADSLIIGVAVVPEAGLDLLNITHARIPTEAAQLAGNWEHSTATLGGQKFPSVQRTVILLASAVSVTTPAVGASLPCVAGGMFSVGNAVTNSDYKLVDRQIVRSGIQLEPVFRVERRNYVKTCILSSQGIDPLNGKVLESSTEIIFGTTLPGDGGLLANGTQVTYKQLTADIYTKDTVQVIGGGETTLAEYTSNDNYYWPPVLASINYLHWHRKDGGADIYPVPVWTVEGYEGPCKTTIERFWSNEPFTIAQVAQMLPKRINFACPLAVVNIPECLHTQQVISCWFAGDSTYSDVAENAEFNTITYPATNYTVWPATIVAYDEQVTFRGGYLRTTKTVYKPGT